MRSNVSATTNYPVFTTTEIDLDPCDLIDANFIGDADNTAGAELVTGFSVGIKADWSTETLDFLMADRCMSVSIADVLRVISYSLGG